MKLYAALVASATAIALLAGLTLTLAAADLPTTPNDQANLRINEFMADNQFTLEDPDEPGEYPDWIELYNAGTSAVSLDGLHLSDDPSKPTRYAITTGLSIPAKGFMLFYADNDFRQGPHHLNFALGRNGGFISLFSSATDRLIDSYTYGVQSTDVSQGRATDGNGPWRFFTNTTPSATNSLLPPVISNVVQTPTKPTAGDVVTVTTATGLVEVPISGTSGIYTGHIPAFPDLTLVSYYLVATDIDSLHGRAPRGAPRKSYRYLVGFDAPLLYINEIMADNEGSLRNPDKADNFPDWFELFNPSPNVVSLDGLFLTDSRSQPTKYAIPPGLSIQPGGFLLFYADNEPNLGAQHTNFRLAQAGEYLAIYANAALPPIDETEYGELSINGVWNRYPDGGEQWVHTGCPTPGAANAPCAVQAHLPIVASN
ncbi:MAG TPA: lamin tail domain-containing protein [Caldilineaceae bacterium]|nr:lamin tail domain-containing protein [Caldilineaceae bacterium]